MNSTKNKVEKEWGSNTLKQNIHIVSLDNPCATQTANMYGTWSKQCLKCQ